MTIHESQQDEVKFNATQEFKTYQNSQIIYFDSASTTQKPNSVLKAVTDYLNQPFANPGRSTNPFSIQNQKLIDQTKTLLKNFLNANSTEEIIMTSGATESLNLIASFWGINNLNDQDEIILSETDHESTISPWINLQKIFKTQGKTLKLIFIKPNLFTGTIDPATIKTNLSEKTKLVVITHIHNIFGTKSNLTTIKSILPPNCKLLIDACQSISHSQIDLKVLNPDFLVFSGHKMFALEGIGGLWINQKHLPEKQNNQEIIKAGTPNTIGIISLKAALEFITKISIPTISNHLKNLTNYTINQLNQLPQIEFLPGPAFTGESNYHGIISFRHLTHQASDLADYLNEEKIYIRSKHNCQHHPESFENSNRLSFSIYNTTDEIDKFIELISKI